MKNLYTRIRRVYLYAVWYITTLYRRKFSVKKKDDHDIAWEIDEKERIRELKHKHYFMYLFEKSEPFIMYPGFFFFLFDPIIKVLVPMELYWLLRGWEGGAVGLGFGSWMTAPMRRKWTFWWRTEATSILRQIMMR